MLPSRAQASRGLSYPKGTETRTPGGPRKVGSDGDKIYTLRVALCQSTCREAFARTHSRTHNASGGPLVRQPSWTARTPASQTRRGKTQGQTRRHQKHTALARNPQLSQHQAGSCKPYQPPFTLRRARRLTHVRIGPFGDSATVRPANQGRRRGEATTTPAGSSRRALCRFSLGISCARGGVFDTR